MNRTAAALSEVHSQVPISAPARRPALDQAHRPAPDLDRHLALDLAHRPALGRDRHRDPVQAAHRAVLSPAIPVDSSRNVGQAHRRRDDRHSPRPVANRPEGSGPVR